LDPRGVIRPRDVAAVREIRDWRVWSLAPVLLTGVPRELLMMKQVKLLADVDTCESLKAFARAEGESVSTLIRRVFKHYVRSRRERSAAKPANTRIDDRDAGLDEIHTRSVKIYFDVDDLSALKAFAVADDSSVPTLMRTVLKRYCSSKLARESEGSARTKQHPHR
jgi:hypothetical protein